MSDFEQYGGGEAASAETLARSFERLCEGMEAHGWSNEEEVRVDDAMQQVAQMTLSYLRDPAGSEAVMELLGETDQVQEKMGALKENIEMTSDDARENSIAGLEMYVELPRIPRESTLYVDNPDLLGAAGFNPTVRAVDMQYIDSRREGDMVSRRIAAVLHEQTAYGLDYSWLLLMSEWAEGDAYHQAGELRTRKYLTVPERPRADAGELREMYLTKSRAKRAMESDILLADVVALNGLMDLLDAGYAPQN